MVKNQKPRNTSKSRKGAPFTSEAFSGKQAKVQEKQSKQTGSRETNGITLSEWEASVPQSSDVKIVPFDILSTAGNPFLEMIQAELKTMQQENPYIFTNTNLSVNGCNLSTLSYYMFYICVSHLRRVKGISGAVPNDPAWVEPDAKAPVPFGLAKLLEYYGPYYDKDTSTTYQCRVAFNGAWPSLTTSNIDAVTTGNPNNMLKAAAIAQQFGIVLVGNTYTVSFSTTLTGNVTLGSLIQNLDTYYAVLRSMRGMCNYGDIPKKAPDASAFVAYDSGDNTTFYCPVKHFDPNVSLVAQTYFPTVPVNWIWTKKWDRASLPNSGTTLPNSVENGQAASVWWSFMLRSCNSYVKGKYLKMMQTSIYCGGKGISSYIPVLWQIDAIPLKNLVNGIIINQDNNGGTFNADLQGWFNMYFVAVVMLLARTGRWAHLCGMYADSGPHDTLLWSPKALKLTIHPLIAEYLTAVGPVNMNGRICFPTFPDQWLIGGHVVSDLLINGISNVMSRSIRDGNVVAISSFTWAGIVGGLNKANYALTNPGSGDDGMVMSLDPNWRNVPPISSMPTDMWCTVKDQVFGDISMYGTQTIRGVNMIVATNTTVAALKVQVPVSDITVINSVMPLTLCQITRSARRTLYTTFGTTSISSTWNSGTSQFTSSYIVNGIYTGPSSVDVAQRFVIKTRSAGCADLAQYLDTVGIRNSYGVAMGDSMAKRGFKIEPVVAVEKLVRSFEENKAEKPDTEVSSSYIPAWLYNGFSDLYNSEPGQYAAKQLINYGTAEVKKHMFEAVKRSVGGLPEAVNGIIRNTGIPRQELLNSLPVLRLMEN